jgi:phenolic acid decarboxylase
MTEPTYRGNAFLYTLPIGWSFRMLFSADGTGLRMEGLTGEHAGQAMEFDITTSQVAHGVYFINWIKPDGGSVSHVHNYNTGTVHAFWSFDQDGERVSRFTTGTVEPIG